MKALYKTADGRIQFEVSDEAPKGVFEKIAAIQELFEADSVCGLCHSTEGKGLRFVVREVDDNKYYEIRCLQCFARLQFGQNKKGGGLFAKRKDKDGNKLEHRGWEKYERRPQRGNGQAAPASQGNLPGARAEQPRAAERQYEPPEYSGPGITDDDVPF